MKAYKGFSPDLTCNPTGTNPFQFAEGETYELDEPAKVCRRGFHAATMPLDVFSYYPPTTSVYHEVEVDDDAETHHSDSKVASRRIKIGAKIDIAGLVKGQIAAIFERTTVEPGGTASGYRGAAQASGDQGAAQASGVQGAAQASGDRGAAQASGYRGAAQASGVRGAAQASGDRGAAQASGYQGAAQASGDQGAAQASGVQGAAQASGDRGAAQASGYRGAAQASGVRGAAQASGDRGAAQASGYQGAAQASGVQGAAQASGYRGAAQASGVRGAAQASGYQGAAIIQGPHGTALAAGWKCRAKGVEGAWLGLVERAYDPATGDTPIVGKPVWVQVGGKHKGRVIKAGVFYGLIDGRVVEVDEDGEAK